MGEGAGGNCPPPLFGIKFKNKLVYFSMEALLIYCTVSQGYNDFFWHTAIHPPEDH